MKTAGRCLKFVEGYEALSRIGPCVSIFGSARTDKTEPEYLQAAEDIAEALTKRGLGVITGGGSGTECGSMV